MSRRRKSTDTTPFDTLRLEGSLFVPELLERAASGEATLQKETDYAIPKGLKLHDEYGRAFRIATATWQSFAPQTARAKGVPERQILLRHALRNALLPMITITGLHVPTLLSGALVTETVFTWPGMGRLFLDSISYRDYPVVMGILMFTAVLVLLGSLIADLLYGVADPRVSGSHR